jgi:hypothetical protein
MSYVSEEGTQEGCHSDGNGANCHGVGTKFEMQSSKATVK